MSKPIFCSLAVSAGLFFSASAQAGVYGDDLGKCLVKSASAKDKTDLVRWMFSAIALHPDISSLSNITPQQRIDIDKQGGALFVRLLAEDCRTEAIAAIKYEGPNAIESGFKLLGEIASVGLFTAPEVAAGLESLAANMDMAKIENLAAEAAKP
ncbi:hypothetical protein [Asticcacaulis machinosus]|uniref:Uncharacterized protein n=1 Tax=Asticcacaulis machinosus TaxID=2984211 RepID=A0ABT5HKN0_9CAUL|nr:hypothetical protein [Asticcacaulis machinosus]MDC7676805.1 hypothetical protein [Asticcacaulis machinosus]